MDKKKRYVIGAGQCGMRLAYNYYLQFGKYGNNVLLGLSTSIEDSVSMPKSAVIQVDTVGSGKKFSAGAEIWSNNYNKLKRELSGIKDSDVVYFASAGGGSGSSSIKFISDILLSSNNRIFLVMVLPFGYETLPFKPNAIRAISEIHDNGYADRMTVLLFNNDKLSKKFVDREIIDIDHEVDVTNLEKINNYITGTASLALDLIDVYHDPVKYSPFTIDELEHHSVLFSRGFLGVTVNDPDETEDMTKVKFEYGNIKEAKNVIVAKVNRLGESNYIIDQSVGGFLNNIKKISRKAKSARIMYGIIRTDKITNGTYIIIANKLDVSSYIGKIREKIGSAIESFRTEVKRESILKKEELSDYDV